MAATVLTVVGYAVGTYFGYPELGAVVGGLVGAALTPGTHVDGSKLSDLKAPQASYGSVIPYLEGAPRVAGVFAWSSDKRQISNDSGSGKGGPSVSTTTYTYEIDVLILLSDNVMSAMRRVWSNGALVWSNSDDASDETQLASSATSSWRDIRFYSGAMSQLPDPTYEAAVGVGNAPAYRARASVFIEGLNLGSSGQLPVLTFEVLSQATSVSTYNIFATIPAIKPYACGTPAFGANGFVALVGQWDNSYVNKHVWSYGVNADGTFQQISADQFDTNAGFIQLPDIYGFSTASGNSDVSCLISTNSAADGAALVKADGTIQELDFGEVLGSSSVRFSNLGPDLIIGSKSLGSMTLLKYHQGSRLPTAASLPLPKYVVSIAIGNGNIYASATDRSCIYQLDLETMLLVNTFAGPGTGGVIDAVVCDVTTGQLFGIVDSGGLYAYDGADWNTITTTLPNFAAREDDNEVNFGMVSGVLYSAYCMTGVPPELDFYASGTLTSIDSPTLDQVVQRLCVRAGLQTSDIDVSQLSSDVVRALMVTQVTDTRSTIQALGSAFFFESVEAQTLRFVKRGGAPVATIPYSDLGATEGDAGDTLPLTRLNDTELPARVTITYANVTNDFQDGSESGDRLVTQSKSDQVTEFAMGFTPTEAKRIADAMTLDLQVSLIGIGPVSLTRKYSNLEPTDVVLLTAANGSVFRSRTQKVTISGGVNTLEFVLDDATVLNSVANTSSSYVSSSLVQILGPSKALLMDIPILRDADNSPGMYVAMQGTGEKWPGAVLYKSSDGTTYSQVLTDTSAATVGTATTLLGGFTGGTVFDEQNTVTVDMGGGVLSSSTRDVILSSTTNAMLIGSEIIQFRNASLVSGGVYTLSGMLRGKRGTEWAMAAHAVGDRAVLLTTSSLRRTLDQQAEIGISEQWKAVTIGKTVASATAFAATDTGVSEKPFSPVDIRSTRNPDSGVDIFWKRRTRLATRFVGTGGINVPLGETIESYFVEILTGPAGDVRRTKTVSAETCNYSASDQTTDFGTLPSSISVRVSQISSVYGKGYPLSANLSVPTLTLASSPTAASTYGLRPVMEIGGILLAAAYEVAYSSSDGGATYSKASAGLPEAYIAGARYLDAQVSSQRISLGFNSYADFAGMIVASSDPSAATTEYRVDPTTQDWTVDGFPKVGTDVIAVGALFGDGTNYFIVGKPATASPADESFFLYEASNSLSWALNGQLTQDPSDANMLPIGAYGTFVCIWFAPRGNLSSAGSKLQKFSGRWFLSSEFGGLYYSDDSAGLTGWLRSTLSTPTWQGGGDVQIVQIGSSLLALGTFSGTNNFAVSSDNGDTWTQSRPIPLSASQLALVVFGSTAIIYYTLASQLYSTMAVSPFTSWTSSLVDGISSIGDILATSSSTIVGQSGFVLFYSTDGITFLPSALS